MVFEADVCLLEGFLSKLILLWLLSLLCLEELDGGLFAINEMLLMLGSSGGFLRELKLNIPKIFLRKGLLLEFFVMGS